MREMLFKTRRDLQHFHPVFSVERNYLCHRRTCIGERSGLVEDHGICLTDLFHEPAALHGDLVTAGLPHG